MNTNEETTTPTRKRPQYDAAFQRSSVEHWLLSGKSARQTAAELGIATQTLQNWQKKFKAQPAGAGAGTLESLQAENRRLQKKLGRLGQQRDILKKTLGIMRGQRASFAAH